jgi:site-specific DNA-cytosine methylase
MNVSQEGQRNPNRLYHQLGNAVSPTTVALIAQQIAATGALYQVS